ncbi:hypothetical protein GLYMA_11G084800v4 [Glycine max]|uniref:Uncharacterized protein n=1 Tax=Glycine max TaxID=3847 RepID=A0A0R0HEH8_SOYBN|nr:hypothetical protein GYH30_030431 [Glycine max]KRH28906.1 hypothetical protein GLYMA_11G084800v4 [Glycine max]|eukprot:XP_006591546.1 uncharacterized protein LOC102666708 [Glycine max]
MKNSESVKMDAAATTMTTASSPIQGGEGSHGDGEKALSLSPQLEIKSGGDDAVAPKGNDEVGQKPTLVGVSHKRKASTETNPFCESDPNSSNDSKRFKSSSVSTPNVEQQKVDEEMRPQEGGDVESEKVEGDKGVPDGGLVEMDSDQNKGEGLTVKSPNDNVETEATESMNMEPEGDNKGINKEGTVNSPSNVEEEKVETEAIESMNVEPEGDDKGMPHGGVSELDSNLIKGEGIVILDNNVEEEKVEIDGAVESMNVEPEGDKGTSHGGRFELDLNRRVDEIVDSPSNVETEMKVESDTIKNMGVEPQGNNDMPRAVRLLGIDLNLEADQEMVLHSPSDAERETTRVEPVVGDKGMPHEGFSLFDLNKEVEEMVEHDDSVDQKIKVVPYIAEENTEMNCAIDKMVQIGGELLCELNKEAELSSDEKEVEAEPAAANAEEKKKKTEVESSAEVEQCAEENNEEDDDDDVVEVEKREVVLALPAIAENLEEDDDVVEVESSQVVLALPAVVEIEEDDDDDVVEVEKREVMLALPAIVENDEVETSPPPGNFVIDLNKPPPGYNNDGN